MDGTRLSARARAAEPFHVMRLLARARELEAAGRRIVHLEIGEPDFPTPAPIVDAGRRALAAGLTQYTAAAGLPALRQAISGDYLKRYGAEVAPERILVTPGASGALQLVLISLLDPGDGVMIGDPSYPCYRQIARLIGCEPVAVPAGPESGYRLTAGLAEAAWAPHIRAVVVASPSNPTGTLLEKQELARLYGLCRSRGAALVVDEIYQGLVFDAADHTALELGEEGLFVINSFSKFYGMTGWRVGWVAAPVDAVDALERLAQNLFIAAPTLAQHAACAAFEPETLAILERQRAQFQVRRDTLLPALIDLGFRVEGRPEGAFYLYARLPTSVSEDSMDFAARLLEEGGVAVTPGWDFGEQDAGRHVRFAYTRDLDDLREGVRRLRSHLAGG